MASTYWFLHRLLLPLLVISCAGCSGKGSQPVAMKNNLRGSAGGSVISAEDQAIENAIVSPAEKAFEPVLAALETYHQKHGCYPAALGDLVNEALLPNSPKLPPVREAFESRLEYRSLLMPDCFVMMFSYHVE